MRTATVSLILAATLAAGAQAQTPAAQTPTAQTPTAQAPTAAPGAQPASVAPQAPAPAAQVPAAQVPAPQVPAPTPAAPSAEAPAAPAVAPPPAEEAAPTVPTTGDGAAILSLVEKVCVPLVRGASLDDLAKANAAFGLKKNRRDGTWTMPLGGDKSYTVTLFPLGSNRDVCRGEVHYALNQEKPIVAAVNIWSFLHQPELILQANYVAVDPDGVKRVRKSWEHLESSSSTAINFSTWTRPDDSSLNAKFSTGEIFYQERKF